MDCKAIKSAELAERYLHNRLNEAETEAFETHLLECPNCRKECELLQAAQADLDARAHEIRTWTPTKPFFLRWQTMSVAALAIVAVAGAFFSRSPSRKTEEALTAQHVPSPTGQNSQSLEKPGVTVEGADSVDNSVNGIRDRRIDELPINGRNYTNFTLKNKGVGRTRDIAPTIGRAPNSAINLGNTQKTNE